MLKENIRLEALQLFFEDNEKNYKIYSELILD